MIKVRGFYLDPNTGTETSSIVVDVNAGSKLSYSMTGSFLNRYYEDNGYEKFRICIGAVMKNGKTWWSEERYIYIAYHNTPVDKPFSFHIYNGFTSESKDQIYYACQNWNNALNLGREVVNTYPYSMGTNKIHENINDGENIVTKKITQKAV